MTAIGEARKWRTVCPFCEARFDLASMVAEGQTSAKTKKPKDGDCSLCIQCGEWAFFDSAAEGGARKPTHAEYEQIAADPFLRALHLAWDLAVEPQQGRRQQRQ